MECVSFCINKKLSCRGTRVSKSGAATQRGLPILCFGRDNEIKKVSGHIFPNKASEGLFKLKSGTPMWGGGDPLIHIFSFFLP